MSKSKKRLQRLSPPHLSVEVLETRQVLATFLVTSDADSGAGTLRDAIQSANQLVGADEIVFDASLGGGQIDLTSGQLEIHADLSIQGPAMGVRIDAGGNSRVLRVFGEIDVMLSDLEIAGGNVIGIDPDAAAGVLAWQAQLTFTRVTIADNKASWAAGMWCGELTAYESTFRDNSAERGVGGIDCDTVRLYDSVVTGNTDSSDQNTVTAILARDSLIMDGTRVTDNHGYYPLAYVPNGGYQFGYNTATIAAPYALVRNSVIARNLNDADDLHGTLRIASGIISGTTISDNQGHAVLDMSVGSRQAVVVEDSVISGHERGIASRGGFTIRDSHLSGNSCAVSASEAVPIFTYDLQPIAVENSTLSDNVTGICTRHQSQFSFPTGTSPDFNFVGSHLLNNQVGLSAGPDIFFRDGRIAGNHRGVSSLGVIQTNVEIANADIYENEIAIDVSGGCWPIEAYCGRGEVTISDSVVRDNVDHAFRINGSASVSVIDSQLTGNTSAADGSVAWVAYDGELTITRSVVSGNSAAGRGGAFYLTTDSTGPGYSYGYNDPGPYTAARLVIKDSTLSANTAGDRGGAIHALGGTRLEITNSTVAGNAATTDGGGIYFDCYDNSSPYVDPCLDGNFVAYSTLTQNSAQGTGGGIAFSSRSYLLPISGSIIAENFSSNAADVADPIGSLDASYTLVGSNQGSQLSEAAPDPLGNIVGGLANGVIDPGLGPLADNGGPTPTHALLAGSPALDAGSPGPSSAPLFDQRGAPYERVVNGRIDIGAYELGNGINRFDLSTLDGISGFVLEGTPTTRFGAWSAPAGDVNGDGFDDWITGAPRANLNAGAAYVVFGNADGFDPALDVSDLNGSNGFAVTGFTPGDLAGSQVGTAGDLNGDGFDELFVVAGNADPFGRDNAGAIHLVFGSDQVFPAAFDVGSLDGTNGFLIPGILEQDFLASAGPAGDINGDGFDDFAVGAWRGDAAGREDSGRAHVIYGRANAFPSTFELTSVTYDSGGFTIRGAEADDRAGHKITAAGDVDGDGIGDLLVGALQADPGGLNDAGATYLLYGQKDHPLTCTDLYCTIDLATMSPWLGVAIAGLGAGDQLSTRIAGAGDVNGDGRDDLFVSAFGADAAGSDSGEAFVVYGADRSELQNIDLANLAGHNGFRLPGIAGGDQLGVGLGGGGDFNGDGFDDLVVTSKNASGPFASDAGQAYVVFGGPSPMTASIDLSSMDVSTGLIVDGASGELLGDSADFVGDFNGDGYDDLSISSSTTGRAYMIFGRNDAQSVTLEGTAGDDWLTGTAADDTIVAGQGNDTVRALGAIAGDVVRAGQGDDRIVMGDTVVGRIDGGSGFDEVALPGGTTFDLVALPDNRIVDVEAIDLSAPGGNLLNLSARDVLNLSSDSNTLVVSADGTDIVLTGPNWTVAGSEVIDGAVFTVLEQGHATLKVESVALIEGQLTGDFDGDLQFTCFDVDPLVNAIATGSQNTIFDITSDGQVDLDDLATWLAFAGLINSPSGQPFQVGDTNLDGFVDGQDFVIWNAHKFTSTGAWCRGDFNADGVTNGADFILWNTHKFISPDDSETTIGPEIVNQGGRLKVSRSRELPWPTTSAAWAPQTIDQGVFANARNIGRLAGGWTAQTPSDRERLVDQVFRGPSTIADWDGLWMGLPFASELSDRAR